MRRLEGYRYNYFVPVFLERFLLTMLAALELAVITNPMSFDATQRITGGLAVAFFAYFVAHTVHKANNPPKAKTSFAAVQEAAKDRAGASPERIFLPPDVSAAYLAGLSDGNTQAQMSTMASAYIGKWLNISGSVDEVVDQHIPATGGEFLVAILVDDPKRQIVSILGFDGRWAERLSILRRGYRIKASGKLKSVASGGLALEQCELLD
jgi:hypothetical protein